VKISEKVLEAARWAEQMHDGQVRKYGGEPYIEHLRRVFMLVSAQSINEDILIAAWLHDVVEDTTATLEDVAAKFGKHLAWIVRHLTMPEFFKTELQLSRKQRHKIAQELYARMPGVAAVVKLADRLDNLRSSPLDNPECVAFLKGAYLQESQDLLWSFDPSNLAYRGLWRDLDLEIQSLQKKLERLS
jgi:(p)ppGpp synthase/HD superfamily hydrolase